MFSYARSNDIFRIDSNYFLKIFLQQEQEILKHSRKTLSDFKCTIRSFGAYSLNNNVEYLDSGVPFVRGVNLQGGRIQLNDMVYISQDAHKLLWKSEVHPKTILLSMSGTIGDVAIASENLAYPINSNQDIAKITCGSNLNPYYLYTFLSSKFGQNYLIREARGSVQQHVFLSQIEQTSIPQFSNAFCALIEKIIKESDLAYEVSHARYNEAGCILLEAVGLVNFTPSTKSTNIKSFRDSFAATGRLDAEYYQRKYEEYQNCILSYLNGWESLNKICNVKDNNHIPNDNNTYHYIELANIDKSGGITGYMVALGKELPSRARRKAQAGDVLVSSIEGSLSSCAIVPKNLDGALCSTGFYVIVSDKINPETLLVLFKSELMQNLLKKNCSGTILSAINKAEFLNLPLPIIALDTQTKIAALVQESFALRAESECLLEVAKRAVEVAIEQDEEAALKLLAEEVGSCSPTLT